MAAEAILVNDAGGVKFTAAATLASGEIVQLADGRPGVIGGLKGFVSGDPAVAYPLGRFAVTCATGTTFSIGDPVYWDTSASLAVTAPGDATDMLLGSAGKAKTSGQLVVEVDFGVGFAGAGASGARTMWTTRVASIAHDDSAEFDLVVAAENPTGLIVMSFPGLVTEAPVGDSEDQLVITLYDSDGNALAAMTTTNTTPDAAGDIVQGTPTVMNAATGLVFAIIPAGKGAYAKVSQATVGGSIAGEIDVRALVMPLA